MAFIFGPKWFYGLDIGFEVTAAVITFLIAVYAFRIFLLTRLRKYLYFTMAFLFISGSNFLRSLADYTVYSSLVGHIPNVVAAATQFTPLQNLYNLGTLGFMVLAFAGFLILVAIYMKINNFRTVTLLFALALAIAALSANKFLAYYITLFVILIFIVTHLFINHRQKRKLSTFLVLYGMACLLAAQAFFLLLGLGAFYYTVGHVLQAFGFVLLLLNLILVMRS